MVQPGSMIGFGPIDLGSNPGPSARVGRQAVRQRAANSRRVGAIPALPSNGSVAQQQSARLSTERSWEHHPSGPPVLGCSSAWQSAPVGRARPRVRFSPFQPYSSGETGSHNGLRNRRSQEREGSTPSSSTSLALWRNRQRDAPLRRRVSVRIRGEQPCRSSSVVERAVETREVLGSIPSSGAMPSWSSGRASRYERDGCGFDSCRGLHGAFSPRWACSLENCCGCKAGGSNPRRSSNSSRSTTTTRCGSKRQTGFHTPGGRGRFPYPQPHRSCSGSGRVSKTCLRRFDSFTACHDNEKHSAARLRVERTCAPSSASRCCGSISGAGRMLGLS
jgi:hypothetical protein